MDDEDAVIDEDFPVSDDEEEEGSEEEVEEDPALLGYRFCAEETIRFLIEEENFATDDPIIVELQQHLDEHRAKLQQQRQEKQGDEGSSDEKAQQDGQSTSKTDQTQGPQPAQDEQKEEDIKSDKNE